jgi:hypothetical protein
MPPLYRGRQSAFPRSLPAMAIKRSDKTGGQLGRRFGVVTLVVALVVGMQLGSIHWRFRREIWRLQGFLLGGLAGYVLGRLKDTPGNKGDT